MPSTCIIIIVAVWATVTEHHRLGGLSHKHLRLTFLETRKYKIKASADLVSGESLLPGLLVLAWQKPEETEREEASFLASNEGTNPITKAPLSGTNYLSMTSFPDIIMLGTRALT